MDRLDEFQLVAVADIDRSRAEELALRYGVPNVYDDYGEMLEKESPDVVAVTTPNNLHAPMTVQAAEAGARGVYCEKPMAVNLREARQMLEACRKANAALAVNHQRRLSPPFVRMRELIAEGAIGQLRLVRGYCAGDLLSDATHLVDLIRHLNGDRAVRWAFGQVHRTQTPPQKSGSVQLASGGWRYGHPVETGAFGVFEFEDGVRGEVLTGDIRPPQSAYAEVVAIGTEGRLWRAGDAADPPLMIDSGSGWQAVPLDEGSVGAEGTRTAGLESYRLFARAVLYGDPHPLSGESAFRDLEVLMAIAESARTRAKLALPLDQEAFPIQLMVDAGEL